MNYICSFQKVIYKCHGHYKINTNYNQKFQNLQFKSSHRPILVVLKVTSCYMSATKQPKKRSEIHKQNFPSSYKNYLSTTFQFSSVQSLSPV